MVARRLHEFDLRYRVLSYRREVNAQKNVFCASDRTVSPQPSLHVRSLFRSYGQVDDPQKTRRRKRHTHLPVVVCTTSNSCHITSYYIVTFDENERKFKKLNISLFRLLQRNASNIPLRNNAGMNSFTKCLYYELESSMARYVTQGSPAVLIEGLPGLQQVAVPRVADLSQE